jgi:hypothetical protein
MTAPNEQTPSGLAALPDSSAQDLLVARSDKTPSRSLKFHELPEEEQLIILKERAR